jgi:succinylarginine dihydrolase
VPLRQRTEVQELLLSPGRGSCRRARANVSGRRAALTPEGMERLETLLMELEYRNESAIPPELRPDVKDLRRKLGLCD